MPDQNVIELPHIKLSNQEFNEMKMMLNAQQRDLVNTALKAYSQIIAQNFVELQNKKPTKVARVVPVYGKNDLLKSALFKRLLEQKKPLDYPPPTNMGNPWYALIDDHEPHPVILTFGVGVASAMTQLTRQGEAIENHRFISLNRHAWHVETANRAGDELLAFLDEDTDHLSNLVLAQRVTDILNASPKLTLIDPNFGSFEFYRGEHTCEYSSVTLDELSHWYGRIKHGVDTVERPSALFTSSTVRIKLTSWLIKKL